MKRWLKIVLGVGVSVGFIALSLRGKDLGAVWTQLLHADYIYLLPYFAILLVIHLVRTVRWGMLIAPLYKPPFRRLNAVSAVGFMLLIILPFRIGEVARPYLIRQPGKLSGTAAFASIVGERVLDGLIVAAMLVLLLLRVPGDTKDLAWVRAGGWGMFAFFGALLIFLLVAYWAKPFALRAQAFATTATACLSTGRPGDTNTNDNRREAGPLQAHPRSGQRTRLPRRFASVPPPSTRRNHPLPSNTAGLE